MLLLDGRNTDLEDSSERTESSLVRGSQQQSQRSIERCEVDLSGPWWRTESGDAASSTQTRVLHWTIKHEVMDGSVMYGLSTLATTH